MKALLALEDGRTFECRSFTGKGEAAGEVVFNTSMTGYQEILTDPSYRGQMVVMTYPLVGNYGVNEEDVESDRIQVAAFIIREYQEFPSNYRATSTLKEYLQSQHILGIHELDTRALTKHIRTVGALRAMISTEDLNPASLVARTRKTPKMQGLDLASTVTTTRPYFWKNGKPEFVQTPNLPLTKSIWQETNGLFRVVAYDFGIKYNILRNLAAARCQILVVPAATSAQTVRDLSPDGIFLSNGPGDPEPVTYAVENVKSLLGYKPIFGICLGIQLLGLALGGRTYKLKFGHRGGNQPVQNLMTQQVEITSQNHGFAVDPDSLDPARVELTHINLNDQTLEGFRHRTLPVFAVQYHPEASPGPHDARYLFKEFSEMMKNNK